MIHIIDNPLAPENRPLLQSMFADRKRLFVDLFGWDVPVVDGQYEIDQFDNADAIYLIVADEDGEHAASIRLFPSIRPHMLGTLFPHLCPFGVPVDEATWESTRLCLPQRHGAERRRELRNMLFSAMVDVALERGIEHYTGVIPDPFRKEVLSLEHALFRRKHSRSFAGNWRTRLARRDRGLRRPVAMWPGGFVPGHAASNAWSWRTAARSD